jgi:hypothetical protein
MMRSSPKERNEIERALFDPERLTAEQITALVDDEELCMYAFSTKHCAFLFGLEAGVGAKRVMRELVREKAEARRRPA